LITPHALLATFRLHLGSIALMGAQVQIRSPRIDVAASGDLTNFYPLRIGQPTFHSGQTFVRFVP
jgi:hypothetical protein